MASVKTMCMVKTYLDRAIAEAADLLPKLASLAPQVQRLCESMKTCWDNGGRVLIAGNGGSAADAMHFAEELSVRFQKNRKALAAIALCDPTVITCAANDFGYEAIFSRQVEAFGRPGDIFIGITTSGNSANILRAITQAKSQQMIAVGFLGKDGGKASGMVDINVTIPHPLTARVQEGHKILIHTICEWVDSKYA